MANHVTVICRVKGQTVLRLTDRFDSVDDIVFYIDSADESSSERSLTFDVNRVKREVPEQITGLDQSQDTNQYLQSYNSGEDLGQTFPYGSNYRWRGDMNYGTISDYQSMDSFKKYMSVIKTVGRQLFVCTYPNCSYQSLWKNGIVNHIRTTHLSFYPFICQFPGCGKSFAIRSNLNNHRKVHSGRSVLWESRELADNLYNYSHYSLVNENPVLPQNRISYKMKTFGSNKDKQQNTIEQMTNERQTLPQSFDTISSEPETYKASEEQPKSGPTNALKSICDIRRKPEKARKSCKQGERKEKGHKGKARNESKPIPAFVGIRSVEHYMETFQRNGKTWRRCLFENCDYITPYTTSIVYHIRNQHLNDKPYVCQCGKSFAMKTNYNNHQRVHKNTRFMKD